MDNTVIKEPDMNNMDKKKEKKKKIIFYSIIAILILFIALIIAILIKHRKEEIKYNNALINDITEITETIYHEYNFSYTGDKDDAYKIFDYESDGSYNLSGSIRVNFLIKDPIVIKDMSKDLDSFKEHTMQIYRENKENISLFFNKPTLTVDQKELSGFDKASQLEYNKIMARANNYLVERLDKSKVTNKLENDLTKVLNLYLKALGYKNITIKYVD